MLLKEVVMKPFYRLDKTAPMRNILIKFTGIFIFMQILIPLMQGQTPSPYYPKTPASPNAAELGKFGAVPVSYYTGLPNIDIPLYNFQCGNYTKLSRRWYQNK